jgi:hypothetical protein
MKVYFIACVQFERDYSHESRRRALFELQKEGSLSRNASVGPAIQFLSAYYIINEMFIPIG